MFRLSDWKRFVKGNRPGCERLARFLGLEGPEAARLTNWELTVQLEWLDRKRGRQPNRPAG